MLHANIPGLEFRTICFFIRPIQVTPDHRYLPKDIFLERKIQAEGNVEHDRNLKIIKGRVTSRRIWDYREMYLHQQTYQRSRLWRSFAELVLMASI